MTKSAAPTESENDRMHSGHERRTRVVNNPNAKANNGDTQTGYVLALHMNMIPDNLRTAAAQKLVDKIEANHGLLGTGFLGTPYLLGVLSESGHRDLAYRLLLNTDYPSWGYLVDHGATTMWERWNGDKMRDDPSMNSYNHYAYGAVADWIYRYAAGIDTTSADAGFHTIYLHPAFDKQLGSVEFNYSSPTEPSTLPGLFRTAQQSGTSPSPPTQQAGSRWITHKPRTTDSPGSPSSKVS
jgi:hypothetical protein